jgi:hypothetical protein
MVANTGRLMQMAASARMPARGENHDIAGRDAFDQLDAIADAQSGADALFVRLAVLDQQHFLDARKHHQRILRNDNRGIVGGDDLGLGKGARPQAAGLIGDLRFDRQRPRAFLDRRADPRDATLVSRRVAFHDDAYQLADLKAGGGTLRHCQLQTQRMLTHDGHDRCTGGAIFTGKDHALADHAVDRRSQRGIVDLLARQRELGAALQQHCLPVADFLERILVPSFGNLQRRICGFEIGLCRDAALDERRDTFALAAGLGERGAGLPHDGGLFEIDGVGIAGGVETEPGPRLLERGFRLAQPQLEIGRGEARDRLALSNRRSEVDAQFLDASGDLEAERDLFFGGKRAADGDRAGQRHALDGRDGDWRGRRRLGALCRR